MSLNRIPVWKGSRKIEEAEDSPEVLADTQGLTITQTYSGTYENCMSVRPAINAEVSGFGAGVRVESSRVKRAPGGRGVLVVVSKSDQNNPPSGGGSPTQSPEISVDWQRVDVPLANSSYFSSGAGALSEDDWEKIGYWQNAETNHKNRYKAFQYQINGGAWTTLTGNALKYAQKIRKGIESVMVFVPVVTRSTPNSAPPATGTCGQREAPPRAVSGYTFLKTADRCVRRNRRWTRDEEWTGFKELDSDLYP